MGDETKQEEGGRKVPQFPLAALVVAEMEFQEMEFLLCFGFLVLNRKYLAGSGLYFLLVSLPPMNEAFRGLLKVDVGFTCFPVSSQLQR